MPTAVADLLRGDRQVEARLHVFAHRPVLGVGYDTNHLDQWALRVTAKVEVLTHRSRVLPIPARHRVIDDCGPRTALGPRRGHPLAINDRHPERTKVVARHL